MYIFHVLKNVNNEMYILADFNRSQKSLGGEGRGLNYRACKITMNFISVVEEHF